MYHTCIFKIHRKKFSVEHGAGSFAYFEGLGHHMISLRVTQQRSAAPVLNVNAVKIAYNILWWNFQEGWLCSFTMKRYIYCENLRFSLRFKPTRWVRKNALHFIYLEQPFSIIIIRIANYSFLEARAVPFSPSSLIAKVTKLYRQEDSKQRASFWNILLNRIR